MNRKKQSADGGSAGVTLKARFIGVNARGLDSSLAFTNLKEVK
jgi:hypothetical protein